jgi:hypothetical protein
MITFLLEIFKNIVPKKKVIYSIDIFYTPDAAEREGREAINTVSN